MRRRIGSCCCGPATGPRTSPICSTHAGTGRFTIGQRRGLGIAWDRPLYVTGIDPARNTVRVGNAAELLVDEVTAREVNWIAGRSRRGLGIAWDRPLYVTGIDPARNTVRVGNAAELLVDEVTAREVNWIAGRGPDEP